MKYQEEKISDTLEELKPMLIKHWEELANNKDVRPLDPDYDTYITLNEAGLVRLFTARDDSNRLVGYFIFVVCNNLHYKTWKHANVDIYYIDPEYRNLGSGSEMVNEVEKWLKSLGVQFITMMDKTHKSHQSFFTRLGYKMVEQNYEKLI